ncbi:MAG TPA: DnaJ domain-containing protein [Ktedonobacteraceae bacterium]|jgi:WD40 repeat protein|nr:DnaJ domain-containing protein [Ktedonobacteraceae bacterium]
MIDTPENYYAILGVPTNTDHDTLKRAYRQLARRYHPDLAGPEGALEMKRINRAYAVLSDPEKRQQYDTIIGGVIDLRKQGFVRPRPRPEDDHDFEFSGLNIFSTRGPFQAGPIIHSSLGVISALSSVQTVPGLLVAAGSLDGKAMTWQLVGSHVHAAKNFAIDPSFTVEALRELRFSAAGSLLAGWNRLNLYVWDGYSGKQLWSYPLQQRAVSAHYSLDMALQVTPDGHRLVHMALPYLSEDVHAPSAWGVRATDVVSHDIDTPQSDPGNLLVCIEEKLEKRQFWAIRMRALSQDAHTLATLSCGLVQKERQQMAIARNWDLTSKAHVRGKSHSQIISSILVGRCEDCTPPYVTTPDASIMAFVYGGNTIRLCDIKAGTYSEVLSGTMGGSSKLALSPDAQWLAVAREDSEINEGVIDLWSVGTGQIVQKFYHPWQISALHFTDKQCIVGLTDGTVQVWQQ